MGLQKYKINVIKQINVSDAAPYFNYSLLDATFDKRRRISI